jgi:glycosyltransferase involved in cell wall biosynthesis
MNKPLVSISCITYNHEPYIRECLDGFLMQKCDFDFEVLIHDDASTDGTQEIIKEYQEKYPEIIKPIFQTENQYSKGVRGMNIKFNFPRAQGKYIALCEGDDYWTDSLKLQKQVDVLEKHPEIDICSHPSYRLYESELKKDGYGYWGEKPHIIEARKTIINYASNAGLQSIVFRKKNLEELTKIIAVQIGGHSTIQIFYSLPNGIYYLPEYMAVYRVGSQSSISKIIFKNDTKYLDRQIQNWKGLDLLNEFSQNKFNRYFFKSKRLRALNVIKTGNLSSTQICYLIKEYGLWKDVFELSKVIVVNYKIKVIKLIVKWKK